MQVFSPLASIIPTMELASSLKRKTPSNAIDDHKRKKSKRKSHNESSGKPGDKPVDKPTGDSKAVVINNDNPKAHRNLTAEPPNIDSPWKISGPSGGRMARVDAIFTHDTKHVILALESAIQVYEAVTGILVRRIPLDSTLSGSFTDYIVSACMSPTNPNIIWVVSSCGWVWRIDHFEGTGSSPAFQTQSKSAVDLTMTSLPLNSGSRDVLLISEARSIVAYDTQDLEQLSEGRSWRKISGFSHDIRILKQNSHSNTLIAVVGDKRVLVGAPAPEKPSSLEEIDYVFYAFEAPDHVCSLDAVSSSTGHGKGKVDLVLGCARGFVLMYRNILKELRDLELSNSKQKRPPLPLRQHWHSRAVYSVKWLQDGSHFFAGGAEPVLISFQIERSKTIPVPHLGAGISNIAMSPQGGLIAISLLDNSCIILSTRQSLEPQAFISGLQVPIFNYRKSIDPVPRVEGNQSLPVPPQIPAVIHPNQPSLLHLSVGSIGEDIASAPMLQTFDLRYMRSLSKHALSRTLATESARTSSGHLNRTPDVTHIAFTSDSKWLASVDDWVPPQRDYKIVHNPSTSAQQHRECHLNIWRVDMVEGSRSSMVLASKINSPHLDDFPRKVFALVADPSRPRFATVGDDSVVRIWTPKARINDGIVVKDQEGQGLFSWGCTKTISLGESELLVDEEVVGKLPEEPVRCGSLVFSEDGSTILVAFGTQYKNVVLVVDSETGEVRTSFENLFSGRIQDMKLARKYLICLSSTLNVYDLVRNELHYGIDLNFATHSALAVDQESETIALSLTLRDGMGHQLMVLGPGDPGLILDAKTTHPIVALLSPPGTRGYIAVDSGAQVWTIQNEMETKSLRVLKSLVEMDIATTNSDDVVAEEAEGGEDKDEHYGILDLMDIVQDGSGEKNETVLDDRPGSTIIPLEKLAGVFNQAPAWAMPSSEELFKQVLSLVNEQR